jgi:hypothetical protein
MVAFFPSRFHETPEWTNARRLTDTSGSHVVIGHDQEFVWLSRVVIKHVRNS